MSNNNKLRTISILPLEHLSDSQYPDEPVGDGRHSQHVDEHEHSGQLRGGLLLSLQLQNHSQVLRTGHAGLQQQDIQKYLIAPKQRSYLRHISNNKIDFIQQIKLS